MAKKEDEAVPNDLSSMSAEDEKTFDEAFAEEPKKSESEKAPKPKDESVEKVVEKQPKEAEESGKPAPKEESEDKGDPKPEDFKQKWKTLQGEFKKVKEENETLKPQLEEMQSKIAEIDKLQDGTKKGEAKAEKKKEDLAELLLKLYDDLTPEEKAELSTYDEEFDVVSKSEAKKRAIFAKKMGSYIDQAIEGSNKALLTQLAPFLMASEKTTEESHFKAIKSAHEDFEKYRDDGSLKTWIEEQPAYLRKEFQRVYNEGESDEVIDLFSRFKKDNNIGTTDKDDEKKKVEQDEKKKKLDKMEVVDTGKRAIGSTGVGKATDYDSAFDEAIKASSR
jgi:hypothetical protein